MSTCPKCGHEFEAAGVSPVCDALLAAALAKFRPEFGALWAMWKQHRKEKRARLTPACELRQLRKCADWGERIATLAIQNSLFQGWIGLFLPNPDQEKNENRLLGKLRQAVAIERLAQDYIDELWRMEQERKDGELPAALEQRWDTTWRKLRDNCGDLFVKHGQEILAFRRQTR